MRSFTDQGVVSRMIVYDFVQLIFFIKYIRVGNVRQHFYVSASRDQHLSKFVGLACSGPSVTTPAVTRSTRVISPLRAGALG